MEIAPRPTAPSTQAEGPIWRRSRGCSAEPRSDWRRAGGESSSAPTRPIPTRCWCCAGTSDADIKAAWRSSWREEKPSGPPGRAGHAARILRGGRNRKVAVIKRRLCRDQDRARLSRTRPGRGAGSVFPLSRAPAPLAVSSTDPRPASPRPTTRYARAARRLLALKERPPRIRAGRPVFAASTSRSTAGDKGGAGQPQRQRQVDPDEGAGRADRSRFGRALRPAGHPASPIWRQEPDLEGHAAIADYVEPGCRPTGAERDWRVDAALAPLVLGPRARRPRGLSGGEGTAARGAGPAGRGGTRGCCCLDEPTNHLDLPTIDGWRTGSTAFAARLLAD